MFVAKFIFILSSLLWAQDFETALQQEKQFLQKQKQSLEALQPQLKAQSKRRLANYEKEILKLQSEQSALQISNKDLQEQAEELKEALLHHSKSSEQTKKSWDLFQKEVFDIRKLQYFSAEDFGTQSLNMDDFNNRLMLLDQAFEALESSTAVYQLRGSYLDQGILKEGTLRRYGLIGAETAETTTTMILGASKENLPEVKLTTKDLQGEKGFIYFNSLQNSKELKLHASWIDRWAHALPMVFLGFVFAIVIGLFGLFIRE
ncbi:MAG: hypothetical protein OM95_11830 [Bdellovibrio sp. ArHS]|uniref:hypothetical protein n=1 Tax=Bdellovibrio sp. ArHS TaxID=1569284 RepID=UPI000583115F|nr:hypothetical protein [Bdellovibrio sp. ArHS]KHD87947.1 MAG: hypothetical protein OM95_11830 [Bdellovibrio sp. ArHS]